MDMIFDPADSLRESIKRFDCTAQIIMQAGQPSVLDGRLPVLGAKDNVVMQAGKGRHPVVLYGAIGSGAIHHDPAWISHRIILGPSTNRRQPKPPPIPEGSKPLAGGKRSATSGR